MDCANVFGDDVIVMGSHCVVGRKRRSGFVYFRGGVRVIHYRGESLVQPV